MQDTLKAFEMYMRFCFVWGKAALVYPSVPCMRKTVWLRVGATSQLQTEGFDNFAYKSRWRRGLDIPVQGSIGIILRLIYVSVNSVLIGVYVAIDILGHLMKNSQSGERDSCHKHPKFNWPNTHKRPPVRLLITFRFFLKVLHRVIVEGTFQKAYGLCGSRTISHQIKIKPSYCSPGPRSLELFPTDQY